MSLAIRTDACTFDFLSLGALAFDAVTPSFGSDYLAVLGSWDGPDEDGAWPTEKFVWFRLHQYFEGQLGPGVMMRGRIDVEL